MIPVIYRGVMRGGNVVLDEAAPLPDGTIVVVTPATPVSEDRGSPAALLAALRAAPPVPSEWVDELELFIDQGRRPPTRVAPFTDEPGNP